MLIRDRCQFHRATSTPHSVLASSPCPSLNPPGSPPEKPSSDVTQLLSRLAEGDEAVSEQLLPLLYEELHRQAEFFMAREQPGHTLQATALVHEAYIRLARESEKNWRDRAHFLAIASIAMRRILVDHARARNTQKRGFDFNQVTLNESLTAEPGSAVDLLALDQALTRLSEMDERQGRVVEMRFFGGLTVDETARILDVSPKTIKRDWRHAKAWLRRELTA